MQGNAGGEHPTDTVRGPLNNGGLFGERNGWYLPQFADAGWQDATLPAAIAMPGTSWYRTTFDLHVPASDDASIGLTIDNPSQPRSSANYRALIFVNGWNMGQYIANVGPQHHCPRRDQRRRSRKRPGAGRTDQPGHGPRRHGTRPGDGVLTGVRTASEAIRRMLPSR